ncbi:Retrovirus-related Pol polyprotein from transposon [Apostichopus japonicus]|uniref:Retrovirus-related Pol polyprotein from transposon n=1 Tax=Stichopus japonicus TaxID=307972 RepID=A0A2G8L095_STIJA|nr:Retrovirus-related Pol polyprotein from transposon [Apostichopus japonicus]
MGAPCLLVSKKNNTDYRFVVDYRRLNACTELEAHPLPTTEESLDSIGVQNPKYFTCLDLQSGFHQILLDPNSRPYTAFRCHLGLFQYKRLPMGLKNSPVTFQRVMETVLRGLTWKSCLVYMDDIIIFSNNFADHISHIRGVFQRLRCANLKLRLDKCQFAKAEIRYLGHVVSSQGILPDPDKLKAVSEYPTPKTLKELRSFLGLSGYYRKFIRNYSQIATPLYALTKRNAMFVWDACCEIAFVHLKKALVKPPILGYPKPDLPYVLYTDASGYALGVVLTQTQNDTERVISYAGRSLNGAELNYGITEKECLALVYGIKHFSCYLRQTKFSVVVDHSALQWLLSMKEPSGKFARWIVFLQAYDFKVKYRPGRVHSNADALSRRVYETEPQISHVGQNSLSPTQTSNCPIDGAFDRNTLVRHQREDAKLIRMINYIEKDILKGDTNECRAILLTASQYFIDDQVLYHVVTGGKTKRTSKTGQGNVIQVVVPRALVNTVLTEMHDSSITGGHYGISRTIEKTRYRYFWEGMYKDIVNWVKSCKECNQRNRPVYPVRAHLQPLPVTGPFQRVGTDILGPLPVCQDTGNKYVLVFIDSFTKYVELVPLPNITARTIATAFIDRIICRHGAPESLHSDRGSNFLSRIVAEVCKLFEIRKTQTTSYHPQCNGQSERMMSVILNSLGKYLDDDHSTWDTLLPFTQFAYNTTPCFDSTSYSPYFLVHGRHPRFPTENHMQISRDCSQNVTMFIGDVVYGLEQARLVAADLLEIRQKSMKLKFDKKANTNQFHVGDTVYLYTPTIKPGQTKKLAKPWKGPYYIVELPSKIHVS